jgi:hypothetical protein
MGKQEKKQGISDFSQVTPARLLISAARQIQSRPSGPTKTEMMLMERLDTLVGRSIEMTNVFYAEIWDPYRALVKKTDFRWFREYEPLEMK